MIDACTTVSADDDQVDFCLCREILDTVMQAAVRDCRARPFAYRTRQSAEQTGELSTRHDLRSQTFAVMLLLVHPRYAEGRASGEIVLQDESCVEAKGQLQRQLELSVGYGGEIDGAENSSDE
jgi:hypothetical protein